MLNYVTLIITHKTIHTFIINFQLISLTFDEAVTKNLVDEIWKPLLFDRLNPDKEPIGGTFFVPHEFSDYVKVNELYNNGFEIAVHSIS